ncbi:phosphoenolpyruvate hydrolase family protein [Tessaracoccus palaemonis]|uniref:Phosphoenolpyruvate hydrolase family protein n=1 Tax=Tessaracoccus palaemonis TaxID=2829499 RepID=A0ABX8SMW0_9ACTN|nr:phosphoenolpyruvate hydrolase family protein [Tessaracoccus palaemonis]QXT63720.1 phosphoenolpyruvate hydrolase family protein [Tessaracoccus palaemonis]
MIRTDWTRESILTHLRSEISAGNAILGAGCSAGLIAKCAEAGGADFILVYSTGRSRLMGLPTSDLGNSNEETLGMLPELDNVVEHTPIVGGIEFADPRFLKYDRLLDKFEAAGFNGLINMPTQADRPNWVRTRSAVGLGLEREAEGFKRANERGFLTLGYALDDDHTRLLVDAGVDILVPHAGWTAGGLVGASSDSSRGLQEGAAFVQRQLEIGRAINPDILVFAHGGPFAEPEQTRYLYENTDAQGFIGASSIERLPVERAVMGVVSGFKAQRLVTR